MTLRSTAVSRPLLLFALLAGPSAWAVHLLGASGLVPAACAHDVGWSIEALTAVTALVCGAGVGAAVAVRRGAGHEADTSSEAARLLAFVALTADVLSLVLVLAEGAMHIWFGACR